MKKILFFATMLFCAGAVMAQNESQTALLQDGDNVQVFYGANALGSAYAAATDGSTISLSEGFFNYPGVYLTKAVNIIGCGSDKTTINSGLNYLAEESAPVQNVLLEGVRLNGDIQFSYMSGFTVSKCRFGIIRVHGGSENITVRQCQFATVDGNAYVLNMAVMNSIITSRQDYSNESSALLFDHCVIMPSSNCWDHAKAIYQNCIAAAGCNTNFGAGSTVKYCICQFGDADKYIKENNWFGVDPTDLFSDGEGFAYSDERTYTLTHPETYIGSDGTEVGLHGGLYPWDMTPNTPVVKNLELKINGTTLDVTYDAEVR